MKTLKLTFALAFFMGLSTFAFANTPKDGAKTDAKTTAKTEVKAKPSSTANKSNSGDQEYYWYTPDGSTYLGYGVNPSTGCTTEGVGCAKGFINDPSNPATAMPDDTRAEN